MRKGIIQIPVPGGSGRVPSGAIQFQDDWPGLFLRGDDCPALLGRLEAVRDVLAGSSIAGFLELQLKDIQEVIERDVMVR
jgi:hypothetical protein